MFFSSLKHLTKDEVLFCFLCDISCTAINTGDSFAVETIFDEIPKKEDYKQILEVVVPLHFSQLSIVHCRQFSFISFSPSGIKNP